jgi:hypothetical protein
MDEQFGEIPDSMMTVDESLGLRGRHFVWVWEVIIIKNIYNFHTRL